MRKKTHYPHFPATLFMNTITYNIAFVTAAEEHWMEWEIAPMTYRTMSGHSSTLFFFLNAKNTDDNNHTI